VPSGIRVKPTVRPADRQPGPEHGVTDGVVRVRSTPARSGLGWRWRRLASRYAKHQHDRHRPQANAGRAGEGDRCADHLATAVARFAGHRRGPGRGPARRAPDRPADGGGAESLLRADDSDQAAGLPLPRADRAPGRLDRGDLCRAAGTVAARGRGRLGGGGLLSFLAIGCPICNKLVVLALGLGGVLRWFAPIQPLLGGQH